MAVFLQQQRKEAAFRDNPHRQEQHSLAIKRDRQSQRSQPPYTDGNRLSLAINTLHTHEQRSETLHTQTGVKAHT